MEKKKSFTEKDSSYSLKLFEVLNLRKDREILFLSGVISVQQDFQIGKDSSVIMPGGCTRMFSGKVIYIFFNAPTSLLGMTFSLLFISLHLPGT